MADMADTMQVRVRPGFYYNPDSGGNYKPGTILEIQRSEYMQGYTQLVEVGSDEEKALFASNRAQKGGARRSVKKAASK